MWCVHCRQWPRICGRNDLHLTPEDLLIYVHTCLSALFNLTCALICPFVRSTSCPDGSDGRKDCRHAKERLTTPVEPIQPNQSNETGAKRPESGHDKCQAPTTRLARRHVQLERTTLAWVQICD
ncbi:unnamed protein product [Protopolystoma xenopodis]|uniref:Uncharacterized protein n=1 Tax=Protopolystoma xenopodis TaxID=117903 RepID=A0A3S5FFU6_9PLAT|nr:unnamed protein product [Protopolystoma xenopodis]